MNTNLNTKMMPKTGMARLGIENVGGQVPVRNYAEGEAMMAPGERRMTPVELELERLRARRCMLAELTAQLEARLEVVLYIEIPLDRDEKSQGEEPPTCKLGSEMREETRELEAVAARLRDVLARLQV